VGKGTLDHGEKIQGGGRALRCLGRFWGGYCRRNRKERGEKSLEREGGKQKGGTMRGEKAIHRGHGSKGMKEKLSTSEKEGAGRRLEGETVFL